jgi:hypothetical protein
MRRLFWLTVGAGLGAWGLHKAQVKAQRIARSMTPQNIAIRTSDRVRLFAEDVRTGMAEREAQLREAIAADLGVDSAGLNYPDEHVVPDARGPGGLRKGAGRRVVRARYTIIDSTENDKDGP